MVIEYLTHEWYLLHDKKLVYVHLYICTSVRLYIHTSFIVGFLCKLNYSLNEQFVCSCTSVHLYVCTYIRTYIRLNCEYCEVRQAMW